jgi:FtsP/CotA-like multicopper oxidase with cupredoxin domain
MLILVCLLLLLCGCAASSSPRAGAGQPLREIAAAVDLSPDPRVVELELTAAPAQLEFIAGHPTEVWAFNGQVPGPTIEANVGDEIVVHFHNRLPEATTVHWHGIRLPQAMDGSHASQAPVEPGDSFEYRFTVPDAGLYWYHPHHNGATQVAAGLYGALLVRDPQEPQLTRERVLVLSDIRLDDDWQLVPPAQTAHGYVDHAVGLHGNYLLVNGQLTPIAELQQGSRERWRIVNACASRYFRLAVPGAAVHQIGGDSGLADRALELSELVLAIGERADLLVAPPPGGTVLRSLPYRRIDGPAGTVGPDAALLQLHIAGPAVATPAVPDLPGVPVGEVPATQRFIQFSAFIDPFAMDEPGQHGDGGAHGPELDGARFFINGYAFPDVPLIQARLGTRELWIVNNHTEMDHPFHLHGFRFLVLDEDGAPPLQRMWKDTVNIRGSQGGEHTVRLLVDFSGHPGRWVYHCHILHHQELGMMAEVEVQP